jgi:hypothetical protein
MYGLGWAVAVQQRSSLPLVAPVTIRPEAARSFRGLNAFDSMTLVTSSTLHTPWLGHGAMVDILVPRFAVCEGGLGWRCCCICIRLIIPSWRLRGGRFAD